jgi:hypothetical protein
MWRGPEFLGEHAHLCERGRHLILRHPRPPRSGRSLQLADRQLELGNDRRDDAVAAKRMHQLLELHDTDADRATPRLAEDRFLAHR